MKVPVSWLREFVDVPGTAEDVADRLSVRGFAVEGIEAAGDERVIDFEVLANRPDCMSILGIAREVATAYDLPLKHPTGPDSLSPPPDPGFPDLEITLENPDLCPRYAGAMADVAVAPAPPWLQDRLRAAGIRPISNIVDVTNYVLLELGQPMHAFDRARLSGGEIRVRTARSGERLRTLDGELRELRPEMLVIADARAAVAVAGVMGGADSEVTAGTTSIVFESAYFNPLSVRRTSRQLGLKTEASMRFERGTDPHLPVRAMHRALELLVAIGAGQPRGPVVDRVRAPFGIEPGGVLLRRERMERLLGVDVPDTDVERVLSSLGFGLVRMEAGWRVSVPTRRVDVQREVDLIEEVARHFGFDRLPVTFPALMTPPPPLDPRIVRGRNLRSLMTGAGFSEAVTFGFTARAAAAPFAGSGGIVAVANPLSTSFDVLRPSLIPGLVASVGHNRRREQRDVRLFEVGARFDAAAGERQALACAWAGAAEAEHWSENTREVDFFDIKGIVERVAGALGADITFRPHDSPGGWLVPGRAAEVLGGDQIVGQCGQLTPSLAEPHGIPSNEPVYVAEVDLDALQRLVPTSEMRVQELPRYPSVTRDISVLIDDTLPAATVRETIRAAAPPMLAAVREFDRYRGKGVAEGTVSLSLRLTFRSPERTLTDADVQDAMDRVLTALKTAHGAVQR